MWNFQRIICIWICCVSCMFGTTQLSSLVQAVPYEYFDDHEQSFYDLDTEQIQAKYDARLLTQQMLQTEQQQQQHLKNLKGFHNIQSGVQMEEANRNKLENRKHNNAAAETNDDNDSSYILTTTTKLKANDENNQHNNEGNNWLEETATKAAFASTSEITDTLDELHLPRAASCFTNGQKYTHGQKVPRLDNCEVCLCMDGEIFCWWEKCDKKSTKASTTYDDYSAPFEESSTTRIQLNPKTTYRTTLKPMKKPKTNEDYNKYDDDDSAEIFEMQQEYEGLKEQLMRKEHEQEQHKIHHNKQMVKKKIYQQQEEEKHNKKIKEQNKKKQEEQQHRKQQKQQQQQQKQQHKNNNEHFTEQHHHAHNNKNNRNNNHDYSSSGSSSKILNFPENLPSVLYYDYKTEEHHQHQHQHREQHLKHQRQKQQQQQLLLQQHEKELKHRQQQQQQQQQQHNINRHHEYGQDFNTYNSNSKNKKLTTTSTSTGRGARTGTDEKVRHDGIGIGGPSTTFKYFSNGNENIYNGDLQTDSDILPEPPTKKPKFLTSITDTTDTTARTTGIPISQFYRLSTSTLMPTTVEATATTTTTSSATKALTNTPPTPSIPLKKQIFSPWDFNKMNRDKINNNNNNNNSSNKNDNGSNNNKESTEDIIDNDEQDDDDDDDDDDAFHRWLTSTEKNNKNNFTLNDSIMDRDDSVDDGDGIGGGGGGVVGLDASNSDYNMDDRNYENIDLETETGLLKTLTKTKATLGTKPASVTVNAFDINRIGGMESTGGGGDGDVETAVIYADGDSLSYENIQKPKYEQNFNVNNSNSNNMANSNGIINNNGNSNNNNNHNNYNKNISPFSNNLYQNYKNDGNNNNNMDSPTSSSGNIISSTTSNEDNGVANVVNIDIMLTASSADTQQPPQQTNVETNNPQRQQQEQDFEHEKQIAKSQLKFIQSPVLISNTNDVDNNNSNNNNNPLYSIINDNTKSYTNNNNNKTLLTHIIGDGLNNEELQNVGVNLSSSNSNNNYNNNNDTSYSLSSSSDSFSFNQISTMVSQTNATSATIAAGATASGASAATTPPLSTTLSPERQCNVMGTLYKIGDVLPQDTGNCLQCICIDGSTSDDTPRVTCSPHNCPPLVLPDLFDATGY